MSKAADRRLVMATHPKATLCTVSNYPWMCAVFSSRKEDAEQLSGVYEFQEEAWRDAAKRLQEHA